MRFFLLLFLLSFTSTLVHSQGLETIELKLSEAVADWQNSAGELDVALVEMVDIQRRYEDIVRARDWMEKNHLHRKEQNESAKKIKSAKKAFKSGEKKVKKLKKALNLKQKTINKLTQKVENNNLVMTQLMYQRDELLQGGKGDGNKVFSGYFPSYKSFYVSGKKDNVFYYHPKFDCKKDFDGTDPILEKHRIEYEEKVFFSHQPDYLPLVNDKPYLQASTYFTLVEGGQFFLNLNVRIQTENPRQDFGFLERGSRLFITFMNGEELVLINNLLNLGTFNKRKGQVLFRGQYSLNTYSQNKIKKNPIDKVRIEWARGYEDYNIYYVDLLQKQFKCL